MSDEGTNLLRRDFIGMDGKKIDLLLHADGDYVQYKDFEPIQAERDMWRDIADKRRIEAEEEKATLLAERDALRERCEELRHDIARHVELCSEEANNGARWCARADEAELKLAEARTLLDVSADEIRKYGQRAESAEAQLAYTDEQAKLNMETASIHLERAVKAEAQLATAREDALEECAKVCEQELQVCCGYTVGGNAPDSPPECCGVPDFVPMAAKECAERIRALSAPLPDKTGVL